MAAPGRSSTYSSEYGDEYGRSPYLVSSGGEIAINGNFAQLYPQLLAGTVAIAGEDIAATAGRKLTADTGSVVITGVSALFDRSVVAGAGAVPIAGWITETFLTTQYKLTVTAGAVDIAAPFTTLYQTYSAGSVPIAGVDVGFSYLGAPSITAETGGVNIVGVAASLPIERKLTVTAGALPIIGLNTTGYEDFALDADAGDVSIVGLSTIDPALAYQLGLGTGWIPINRTGVIDNDDQTGIPPDPPTLNYSGNFKLTCPVYAYEHDNYITAELCRCE